MEQVLCLVYLLFAQGLFFSFSFLLWFYISFLFIWSRPAFSFLIFLGILRRSVLYQAIAVLSSASLLPAGIIGVTSNPSIVFGHCIQLMSNSIKPTHGIKSYMPILYFSLLDSVYWVHAVTDSRIIRWLVKQKQPAADAVIGRILVCR